jgi:hypothetical protein
MNQAKCKSTVTKTRISLLLKVRLCLRTYNYGYVQGLFLLLFHLSVSTENTQTDTLTKAKFVIGLSAPDLLHAGIGPSSRTAWPTLNIEHQSYFECSVSQPTGESGSSDKVQPILQ